jgi:predicted type IV restriction endonuclease
MSSPATFETFQQEFTTLVERFDREFPQFKSPEYNEATLRADFTDPLFRALGWDVGNTKCLIHSEREANIGSLGRTISV